MRKNLPLGRQNFEDIIKEDLLYVDKTEQVYNIIRKGRLFFLARPRRFGKSLLISTFRHLFEGKKELFKDLYIGQSTDYDFETFPVLQFNFAKLGHGVEDLEAKLNRLVLEYAEEYAIELTSTSLSENFTNLVKGISEKDKPVVLLVDEYDKPMIDFFTEMEKAKINRSVLRDFFSPLKDLDSQGHLRFLFITGVSKFSKVSLFSDLNNLTDLSVEDPLSYDVLGIKQEELESYFEGYLTDFTKKIEKPLPELLENIKDWYNGYSFGGNMTLYNPYSLLLFFHKQRFGNYWFETGTPTFLVETIRKEYVNPNELEHIEVDDYFFNSFSLEQLDIVGLLFQTGYLTIKEVISDFSGSSYVLGYPNIEVRHSMIYNLTQAYTYKTKSIVSSAMVQMKRGLEKGNVKVFVEQLQVILSDISYHLHPSSRGRQKTNKKENKEEALFAAWEGYFQTIIYLVTSYMDMTVQSEVTKHKGRLDLVAESADFIYLMEFKLDETAAKAIEQIKNKKYAAAYLNAPKKIFLVGVNFSKEERNVEDWEFVEWER